MSKHHLARALNIYIILKNLHYRELIMSDEEDIMRTPGWHWRISLSIIMGVGWLVFLILWLFFYAENFSVYQNIAIFIVSLLVVGGVLGAAWAPWGMRHSRKYT